MCLIFSKCSAWHVGINALKSMLSVHLKYKTTKNLKNYFFFLVPKSSTHTSLDCVKKTRQRIYHDWVPLSTCNLKKCLLITLRITYIYVVK